MKFRDRASRIEIFKINEKIKNIHRGEVLQEEFLVPLGIIAYRLAKDIKFPPTRVAAILKGERRVTADTACVWASIFFWRIS